MEQKLTEWTKPTTNPTMHLPTLRNMNGWGRPTEVVQPEFYQQRCGMKRTRK